MHMDVLQTYKSDLPVRAKDLSDWLLARGLSAVTTADVAFLLGIPADRVRQRMVTAIKHGRFVSLSRGLWVPVPPGRILWGAPEPAAYLDSLMSYLGARYYVGWLSAAALHGASHQASQLVQIATNKRILDRSVGRSRLHFLTRGSLDEIPTRRAFLPSGVLTVSTAGATMLDIAEDLDEAGGINKAATVITELARENPDYLKDVLGAATVHSDAAVRRVGWILDVIAFEDNLDELEKLARGTAQYPSLLSPHASRTSHINKRWMIDVNRKVDPDL